MLAMVWEGRRVLVRDTDPPETTWLGDLTEQCCGSHCHLALGDVSAMAGWGLGDESEILRPPER